MALDRAMYFSAAFKRRRDITAPGAPGVARIKSHGGFEFRYSRGHQVNHSAAHAEADDADAVAIYSGMAVQQFDRRGYVVRHAPVAQPGAACAHVVLAIGAVAMVKVRCG